MKQFVGIVNLKNSTALSTKIVVDDFLAKHSLSISTIRGHGYDGALNMRFKLIDLKTNLNKNPCSLLSSKTPISSCGCCERKSNLLVPTLTIYL